MDSGTLRQLAIRGAALRLEELQSEALSIRESFPELATREQVHIALSPTSNGRHLDTRSPRASKIVDVPSRQRKPMSRQNRAAVSQRMTKYWADRRRAAK